MNRQPCHVLRGRLPNLSALISFSGWFDVARDLTSCARSLKVVAGYVAALGSSPQTMRTFCKQLLGARAISLLRPALTVSNSPKLPQGSAIPLDFLKHVKSIV